jgi:hypothetical protein
MSGQQSANASRENLVFSTQEHNPTVFDYFREDRNVTSSLTAHSPEIIVLDPLKVTLAESGLLF